MSNQEIRLGQLAKTNPLFGPAKLKLGVFCPNVSGGATMSSMEDVLKMTWPNAAHIVRLADEMKFEAIVPIARWRGFGGDTDFNSDTFEAMTFAAAAAATTRNSSVFATLHVPSMHPVMAAKQSTTVDHVSQGRFSLNIVNGWNEDEIGLFGGPAMDHDERYAASAEWISLMKRLWTSNDPVDFSGKYYQVKNAFLRPRPVQPYPALMSAGASPKGRAFATEHCDIAFTALVERDVDSIRERLKSYHQLAHEKFGRKIKVWINAYVFLGESEADAQRKYDHCVIDKGDYAGVENLLRILKFNTQTMTPEILERLKKDFIAGWGGFRIQGKKEKIVDDLKMLAEAGADGVLLSFPAFIKDMERFQAEVHPLLVQAGLRLG